MSRVLNRFRMVVLSVVFAAFFSVGAVVAGDAIDSDVVIPVKSLSGKARYFSATVEGYPLQLFAVVAPDKTVRVVFNACQACGVAGFNQKGDAMACSACGQAFKLSVLEQQRGGCNPIPVGEKNRSLNASGDIVIGYDFLKQVKNYFIRKWPR